MKKVLMIAAALLLVGVAFSQKSSMMAAIESGKGTAILISIVFVALLVFFPVVPFAVIAGLIGSVFGVLQGTGISLAGVMLGSMAMFWMSRYGFQELMEKILRKYPKAGQYEGYFEDNAFLSILALRLVPVIPAPLLNILTGMSSVRSHTFFLASLLGKIPVVLIFTLAGSVFTSSKWSAAAIYGVYFLTIMIIMTIYFYRKQDEAEE